MANALAEERKIKLKCLPINKKQTISSCWAWIEMKARGWYIIRGISYPGPKKPGATDSFIGDRMHFFWRNIQSMHKDCGDEGADRKWALGEIATAKASSWTLPKRQGFGEFSEETEMPHRHLEVPMKITPWLCSFTKSFQSSFKVFMLNRNE